MAAIPAVRGAPEAPRDHQDPAVPRLARGLVERPRLFALLDDAVAGPVTLVCASAGSGKTMLVSSWLRSAPRASAVAWVDVDRDETDATRFWGGVVAALQRSGAIPAGR